MMIIVAILGETGIFYQVGIKMVKVSKGNVWTLMLLLCTFSGVDLMFVDNVTTILLMVPVTLSITRTLKIHPIPFIIAQVLVSNIEEAATLIGDPPNILIGSAAGIDFNSFLIYMGPTMAIIFVISLALLKLFFNKELKGEQSLEKESDLQVLMHRDEDAIVSHNKGLLIKSLIVLVGVMVFFAAECNTFRSFRNCNRRSGGIAGHNKNPLRKNTVRGGLGYLTVLYRIVCHCGDSRACWPDNDTGKDCHWHNARRPLAHLCDDNMAIGIASAFVDNIPFTTTMIPLVHSLISTPSIASTFGTEFQINPLWWALALGADLGGNGTLIGSSAGGWPLGLA